MSEESTVSLTSHFLHPLLEPPHEVLQQLFPDNGLSVLNFINFPFPTISYTKISFMPVQFFSMDQPTITDIGKLCVVPMGPSPSVVKTLMEQCLSFLQRGVKSLTCPHTPDCPGTYYLPIWTLSYWCEVVELQHKHLVPWLVRP